jgi:Ca2+-binding RTX toxin-like protein
VGSDKLDITALFQASGYGGSNPVGDGYITLLSDGAGGTKVLYDPDGFGGGYPWHVATLAGVSPTTPVASLLGQASAPSGGTPPGAGGQVLTATDAGGWLVGGAGNDVLISGRGASTLMGGGGADSFVFKAVPWSAEQHIADFVPGTDKIDFTALFTAAGYHGSDPVADGYLRFVSDGADGTKVLYDADGWGSGQQWPYLITTIDHVAPGQITPNDWIFH